jgi:ABC-type glycerol-3-phosphate transport system substrate-binding protein
MNKAMRKKLISMVLILAMLISVFSGCSKKSKNDSEKTSNSATTAPSKAAASKETKVLRFGTHYVPGLDPNYKDPTTGEYTMPEAERQAALAALDAVKKQMNVEIEFVQYATDTRSELITSVLANNPVCDMAIMGRFRTDDFSSKYFTTIR